MDLSSLHLYSRSRCKGLLNALWSRYSTPLSCFLHNSRINANPEPLFHSNIRQIPDNQEVFLDVNGFSSLTFDLTERVTQFATDKEALEYHFSDIIGEGDSKKIWTVHEHVDLPKFS